MRKLNLLIAIFSLVSFCSCDKKEFNDDFVDFYGIMYPKDFLEKNLERAKIEYFVDELLLYEKSKIFIPYYFFETPEPEGSLVKVVCDSKEIVPFIMDAVMDFDYYTCRIEEIYVFKIMSTRPIDYTLYVSQSKCSIYVSFYNKNFFVAKYSCDPTKIDLLGDYLIDIHNNQVQA